MSHFRLLKNPESYVAHNWDLLADEAARSHWLGLFESHFAQALKHAATQYGRSSGGRIIQASNEFNGIIRKLHENPASLPSGKLSIMELCRMREGVLRKHRLGDPFKFIKERENSAAAKLYMQVVRKTHAMPNADKWLHLVECVFAGNIFDLGSTSTMHLAHEATDFLATIEQMKPRPWLVDDFDRLLKDLPAGPGSKWGKAVIFVDNAGADFILGVMPLARELAILGTRIVLAANEVPSLNDVTADECANIIGMLMAMDDDLAALVDGGMFEVVSSGNDIPLIDLASVSDELNEAAADADLLILEGMGRAVESNFDAAFSVDTVKLALLKDSAVAARIGGEVFDCICKYEPAGG
jgi:type II pantothenate kinase